MTLNDMTNTKDDYYRRAASWADDQLEGLRASRRLAWIIAGAAFGIAALEAVALVALAPLKTVVPYTLLVDRNTGYVQVAKGTRPDAISADEALVQSLLAQYVIAREGFDIAGIQGHYRKVALWSADAARRDYLAGIAEVNPESPLRRLPRATIVAVTVKSVSAMVGNAALVRFDTQRIDEGQAGGVHASFVAVIRYRFVGAPMAIEDRLINPLGFQIISYRRDQEVLTPLNPPAPVRPAWAPSSSSNVIAAPTSPEAKP